MNWNVERSGLGLFEVLFQNLPGGIEENHQKFYSGWPRFEPSTSQMLLKTVTAAPSNLVSDLCRQPIYLSIYPVICLVCLIYLSIYLSIWSVSFLCL